METGKPNQELIGTIQICPFNGEILLKDIRLVDGMVELVTTFSNGKERVKKMSIDEAVELKYWRLK